MNRLFLVLLIFPLMFISCEEEVDNQNNDDQNNNNSVSILGTWRFVSETITDHVGYIDPVSGNEVITQDYSEVYNYPLQDPDCEDLLDYYDFLDNTMFFIETCGDGSMYIDSYNYTLIENELLFNSGDMSGLGLTITELTDNYLTLFSSNDMGYTENDTTFIDRISYLLVLVKSDFTYLEDQNSYNNKSVRRNHSFVNRKMSDR